MQLDPIRTLSALSESFGRESLHHAPTVVATRVPTHTFGGSPLEVAYVTRWIELRGGRKLRDWRALCQIAGP